MSATTQAGGPPGPPAKTQPLGRAMSLGHRTAWLGLLLVAPVVVYLLLLQAYPFVSAVMTSLTDKRIGSEGAFIGLQNYVELFQDSLFQRAVRNSLVFTFGSIALKLFLGVIMALVLNQGLRGTNLWRALLFLPWTIPTIAAVLTWSWMYSSTGGVINSVLLRAVLISRPIDWLGTPANAMLSVIIANVWRGAPFFGISLLGALQSISHDLYEVAEIDGANTWQRFVYITVPSIRDVALLVTLVSTIWTLNDFQIIWVLTRGGPANSTQVFSTLTYTSAFLNLELGRGIAISMASVPLLALLIGLVTRSVLRRNE